MKEPEKINIPLRNAISECMRANATVRPSPEDNKKVQQIMRELLHENDLQKLEKMVNDIIGVFEKNNFEKHGVYELKQTVLNILHPSELKKPSDFSIVEHETDVKVEDEAESRAYEEFMQYANEVDEKRKSQKSEPLKNINAEDFVYEHLFGKPRTKAEQPVVPPKAYEEIISDSLDKMAKLLQDFARQAKLEEKDKNEYKKFQQNIQKLRENPDENKIAILCDVLRKWMLNVTVYGEYQAESKDYRLALSLIKANLPVKPDEQKALDQLNATLKTFVEQDKLKAKEEVAYRRIQQRISELKVNPDNEKIRELCDDISDWIQHAKFRHEENIEREGYGVAVMSAKLKVLPVDVEMLELEPASKEKSEKEAQRQSEQKRSQQIKFLEKRVSDWEGRETRLKEAFRGLQKELMDKIDEYSANKDKARVSVRDRVSAFREKVKERVSKGVLPSSPVRMREIKKLLKEALDRFEFGDEQRLLVNEAISYLGHKEEFFALRDALKGQAKMLEGVRRQSEQQKKALDELKNPEKGDQARREVLVQKIDALEKEFDALVGSIREEMHEMRDKICTELFGTRDVHVKNLMRQLENEKDELEYSDKISRFVGMHASGRVEEHRTEALLDKYIELSQAVDKVVACAERHESPGEKELAACKLLDKHYMQMHEYIIQVAAALNKITQTKDELQNVVKTPGGHTPRDGMKGSD